jgi:hypothetical protein
MPADQKEIRWMQCEMLKQRHGRLLISFHFGVPALRPAAIFITEKATETGDVIQISGI